MLLSLSALTFSSCNSNSHVFKPGNLTIQPTI
jgi:hypothetical protein